LPRGVPLNIGYDSKGITLAVIAGRYITKVLRFFPPKYFKPRASSKLSVTKHNRVSDRSRLEKDPLLGLLAKQGLGLELNLSK
jgi:hypothetical protein